MHASSNTEDLPTSSVDRWLMRKADTRARFPTRVSFFTLGVLLAACGSLPGRGAQPRDGSGSDQRRQVIVDETQILIRESFPMQLALVVRGFLSTPCDTLTWQVSEPDEQNRILVDLYGMVDPEVVCVQVLQQFEETIELGSYTGGSYTVWLNGELVEGVDL